MSFLDNFGFALSVKHLNGTVMNYSPYFDVQVNHIEFENGALNSPAPKITPYNISICYERFPYWGKDFEYAQKFSEVSMCTNNQNFEVTGNFFSKNMKNIEITVLR